MTTEEFDKMTEGMNMFRMVQRENDLLFYSGVLYRSQVHTLIRRDQYLINDFPNLVALEMRHSYTKGLGDWKLVESQEERV